MKKAKKPKKLRKGPRLKVKAIITAPKKRTQRKNAESSALANAFGDMVLYAGLRILANLIGDAPPVGPYPKPAKDPQKIDAPNVINLVEREPGVFD